MNPTRHESVESALKRATRRIKEAEEDLANARRVYMEWNRRHSASVHRFRDATVRNPKVIGLWLQEMTEASQVMYHTAGVIKMTLERIDHYRDEKELAEARLKEKQEEAL